MCNTTSSYSYKAHYLHCMQLNRSPHLFKTNFHHFSPIFQCNNTNPHNLWMEKKKKNENTLQACIITWPAPCRLEVAHRGSSCCFALCEIKQLRTIATCSTSINSVEIFYVRILSEALCYSCCFICCLPRNLQSIKTQSISNMKMVCVLTMRPGWFPFSHVYSPGPPMLNILFGAGSYYFWQKKRAAVPCEMYAPGNFLLDCCYPGEVTERGLQYLQPGRRASLSSCSRIQSSYIQ